MPRKVGNSKRSFTLVEVLVAASIALFTLIAVISLYITSQNSFVMGTAFLEINAGTRLAMDCMVKDIKWATQVFSSKNIDSQTYTTATNELVLEIPSISSSGDIMDGRHDYIVYHLDSTTLKRIIDADVSSNRVDETRIIANNVASLIFSSGLTELSSIADVTTLTNIAIDLTTAKILSGRPLEQSINSIAELRNKE